MVQCRSLICFALVLACAAFEAAGAADVSTVRERGELIVLTWPHQENPFTHRMVDEYGDEGLQIVGGIDIELMRRFAQQLGVELRVEAVRPDFAALLPKLIAGDGDVVASSLTITAGRRRLVDFSAPYFEVRKLVVARQDSSMQSVADLAGKIASVVGGSSHEEQLRSLLPDIEIRPVRFVLESYLAVAEGEADYTVVDSSSAEHILSEYPDLGRSLEVSFEFPESDHFGFAVALGSDLKPRLDRFLDQLRRNGELDRILARFLRPKPAGGEEGSDTTTGAPAVID